MFVELLLFLFILVTAFVENEKTMTHVYLYVIVLECLHHVLILLLALPSCHENCLFEQEKDKPGFLQHGQNESAVRLI
jgi:hypothetical protein